MRKLNLVRSTLCAPAAGADLTFGSNYTRHREQLVCSFCSLPGDAGLVLANTRAHERSTYRSTWRVTWPKSPSLHELEIFGRHIYPVPSASE
jgi:hypothetical protein